MKRAIFILVAILSASMLMLSCGGNRPDFEDVVAKAIEATGEVQTYRMEMESNWIENGKEEQSVASMEFVAPDRTHVLSGPSGSEKEESIQIGTILYTRSESSTEWNVRDWGNENLTVRDMAVGTIESSLKLVDITQLKDEKIEGIDCFHFIGKMNMKGQQEEQLASLDQSDPHYEQRKSALESMLKSTEIIRDNIELWIGKDDYMLYQYRVHIEQNMIDDIGEETEEIETYSSVNTVRFFDFNEPIEIDAPPAELVKSASLVINSTSSAGGSEDLSHQVIKYEISVSNRGIETAQDVQVFVDSPATNQGLKTMEAEAERWPADLKPGESLKYLVNWEYDLSLSSKEELIDLLRQTVIRATWTDENGERHETEK